MSHRDAGEVTTQGQVSATGSSGVSRRRYLQTSALLGTTVGLTGCLGGSEDTLTVGFVLPFTGVYSLLGESIVNGFEQYLDEQGGEIGGQEVETISRDTEADTNAGVSATRELLVESRSDVLVGPVSSAVATAMMQTVENESSAIWLNANAGDYRLVQDGCLPYHFRTSFNDWQTSAPLAPWVYENVADNVFLAYADYAFGQNSKRFFGEAFEEAGGEVVGEVGVPLGTDDFSPYLGEIENSGAEAVYSFFAGSDAVNYVTQFHEFGLDRTMTQTGSGFLLSEDTLPAQGQAALGKFSLLHYTPTDQSERNQEFAQSYADTHDTRPNVYACQGYDSAQAFAMAIEDAGSSDPDDLAGSLNGAEIDSPRGSFRFHPKTNDPVQNMYVREVVEGSDGPENRVVDTLEDIDLPTWGCSID
ncbi:chemotactic signal transduction system substrate-binding protein BasB [Halalkalicoccus paucihalophilus]|uniref:Chemotactic signal transduction system substrate-binding protein BasB n=1 Tax=Halalkalicoccus paucihalophilus TaxID=1008153 RepID=A0A151A880_9EURY|nr:ABC transporter substrate-binding protein [Halalkalicoccus paucihalophilus]KYH23845.1 chemotactic signal transduction system substrate-binding protein BasB [Halalkalicoccus paucihalophilus]